MKIDCIRTHHLRHRLDAPFGFSQWYYDTRNTLLVEIIADDGTTGWGECYGPAEVYQAAISSFYGPRLLGLDPLATDRLWHDMWQWSLDFARGGIMMGAMSGIDIALWDLKGKTLGLSVSELMGGRYRDTVPGYATGMYFKDMPEDALSESLIAEAVGYREQGFKAMKIKIGKNPAFDVRLIAAMREALPHTTLMADANHAYDLPEAVRVGQVLDKHNYAWFEERTARPGLLRWDFRGTEDPICRFFTGHQCSTTLLGHDVESCCCHALFGLRLSRTGASRGWWRHSRTRSHAESTPRRTL